ncbi:MAG: hypothetical protein KF761_14890 [Salinibacterium sp.]|nr:hypothetical protein [Salinibacterium sp.]
MFTQPLSTVAIATAMVIGLAGCSLIEPPPEAPLTGIAACTLGKTWNLDTGKLAEALTAELASQKVTAVVAVDGHETLAWDLTGKVTVDTDYTITSTSGAEGQQTVVTGKHSGKSTGIAYINAEVAIPRNWDASGLTVTTKATLNGADLEQLPYELVNTELDDSVGVELTCDGGTLTTHQRGSDIILTWSSK